MDSNIFDKDFFSKLNTLKFVINMKLSRGSSGGRKSINKGTSVEFSDFREYVLGDDYRRIDWNAFGRFEQLYVKLFMEEREAVFNVFLDTSKSMDFGGSKKSKKALQLAASLSYIINNSFDRVKIHTINSTNPYKIQPMSRGKSSFQEMLTRLGAVKFEGETILLESIKKANISSKGVSIIISDFMSDDSIENIIKYLMHKKQEILLIHIMSREELEPDFDEVVNLIDSETNNNLRVLLTSNALQEYEKTLNDFFNDIQSITSRYGAKYVRVQSDEELDKIFLKTFAKQGILNKS